MNKEYPYGWSNDWTQPIKEEKEEKEMKKKYEFETTECEHEWCAPYIGNRYGYAEAACWDCVKCGYQYAVEVESPEYDCIHVAVCEFCGLPREDETQHGHTPHDYPAYCECIVYEEE